MLATFQQKHSANEFVIRKTAGILFLFLLIWTQALYGQSATGSGSDPIPNVFLDCNACDVTYIRTNITFVNYVRDQEDASIYLDITDQRTGGGGREFTLIFSEIGKPDGGRVDTLRYSSPSSDTNDERRIGLNRYIKIGLVPYLSGTVALNNLDIFYEAPEEDDAANVTVDDPWNNWIFDVNVSSNINGQASETNFGFYSGLEAERTTYTWKIRARARGEIRRRNIELTDETLKVNRDWGDYWGMIGYSLTERSTVAIFTRANFSRNNNIALNTYIAPAIEYSFFPYDEFQQRRFIVEYQVTPMYRRYFNTTVFLKDSETIMSQELSTRLRYDQRWGRIDIRVAGMHFFHDTSINRFEVNPSFNIRIIRGLSVRLSGRYRIINDQLSLEAQIDPNDPDNIIRGTQRPTSYDYSISFGLSYTFGSIYNNIVNPRF